MARGNLKFPWRVYSARRRLSVRSLLRDGVVSDYASYVAYCNEMSVVPLTEQEFLHEGPKPPPEPVIEAAVAEGMPAAPAVPQPSEELAKRTAKKKTAKTEDPAS